MSLIADAVHINVITQYLPNQSSPEDEQFAFAYTIHIANHSERDVQLLDRHWIITDAHADIREVRGEGVIGEQPVIRPGTSFEYTSGAVLATPSGSMAGSYGMVDQDGNTFTANIPEFTLNHPGALH